MLAPHLVEEVRRLLEAGKLSRRKIARLTGVSRGTVGLIAADKRRDPVHEARPWDVELDQPLEPPERCPSCGGWVYMPCRLCRMRRFLEKRNQGKKMGRVKGTVPFLLHKNRDSPLGLALKPDHQRRYEEVRRRREKLGIVEESFALENRL